MSYVHKNAKVTMSVGVLSRILVLLDGAIEDESDDDFIQEIVNLAEAQLNAEVRYESNQVLFIKNEGDLL
jgi:hypothetical protein